MTESKQVHKDVVIKLLSNSLFYIIGFSKMRMKMAPKSYFRGNLEGKQKNDLFLHDFL